jgi:pilus assembly protein CpaE
MTRNTRQDSQDPEGLPDAAAEPASDHIAPVPRISVQAFCETEDTATAIRAAGEDRRLGKAHLTVKMGGIAKATEVYQTVPTPNVIVLETDGHSDVLDDLDQLAGVCDPGTRVIVIGSPEDDVSYRELVRRGINDYIIGPIEPLDAIRSICSLFSASDTVPTGRIIAVVGAKGGVGASTIAHNVAWMIARDLALDSVVIDLDLAFGTAGLDYNKDPLQGIANAVFQPDRPDTGLMERLFAKCTDNLNLLAAPATLERVYDFGAEAFDAIFDTLRMSTPCIILDVPHQWSAWTKRVLISADEILVVAEPDLANLRNAKNLLKELKTSRPNDRSPLYCINQIGLPKRPEITVKEFAKAMECQPVAAIPFDSRIFGTAANNGQMIAEISATHRTTKIFRQMADVLTGRVDNKKSQGSLLSPIVRKFRETFAPRRAAARTSARQ